MPDIIKELRETAPEGGVVTATLRIDAMSLDIPAVAGHPNRMPFSGILTRVGVASDKAPHGTNGKRVLLTQDAASAAIASLMGMGVDLTADLDGHDAQKKVGVITGATVDGDALHIDGFIYCADFPKEALRIHLNAADLGFSFEAQNLAVESLDADPLIVKSLVFTGAAILMKDTAAYKTTAIAAAAAKEHEMNEELAKAISDAVKAAIEPVATQVTKLEAGMTRVGEIAASVEDLRKNPPIVTVQANAVTINRVEPHAKALEACAAAAEADGIGAHPSRGHAVVMRKMAGHMRSQAAQGTIPGEYNEGSSYYAAADQRDNKPVDQLVKEAVAAATAASQPAPLKIEDDPAFKAMKDELASAQTKIKDMQAGAAEQKPALDRKTLPPFIASVMSKAGLEAPEGDKKMSVSAVDEALAKAGITDTHQRIAFKTGLRRGGLLDS